MRAFILVNIFEPEAGPPLQDTIRHCIMLYYNRLENIK